MNSLLTLVAMATVLGTTGADGDTCQTLKTCVFEISTGHFVDLTPIQTVLQTNDKKGEHSYKISPCKAFQCKNADDALACGTSLASTDVLIPKDSTASCMNEADGIALQYKQNTTVVTISLKCSADVTPSLQYEDGAQTAGDYKFILSSRYACDNSTAPPTMSTKSTATSKSTATTKTTKKTTATTKTTPKTTKTTAKTTKTTPKTTKTTAKTTKTTAKTTKTTSKTTKTTSKTTKTTSKTSSKTTKTSATPKTTPHTPKSTTHGGASGNSAVSFLVLSVFIVGTIVRA